MRAATTAAVAGCVCVVLTSSCLLLDVYWLLHESECGTAAPP